MDAQITSQRSGGLIRIIIGHVNVHLDMNLYIIKKHLFLRGSDHFLATSSDLDCKVCSGLLKTSREAQWILKNIFE